MKIDEPVHGKCIKYSMEYISSFFEFRLVFNILFK